MKFDRNQLQQQNKKKMVPEGYNPQYFLQLIASATSFASKIQQFSNSIAEAPLQDQLQCLEQVHSILTDSTIPIIKKLFSIRFIKDTMILASLSFYEAVLVKIYPWLFTLSHYLHTQSLETKMLEVARFVRGNRQLPTAEMSVCKNFINLVQDVIKWMGTYIQDHPYSQIKFKSAFRILLQKTPHLQLKKVTSLNFFKEEDPNRYQAYYLQKDSGDSQGQKFFEYIKQIFDRVEKGDRDKILKIFLETGDGNIINSLMQQFDTRFEYINRAMSINGMYLLNLLHDLFEVGEIQFCNRVKLQLLPKITNFIQMLHHYKIYSNQTLASVHFADKMVHWQSICEELQLPVECFKTAFQTLKKDRIIPTVGKNQSFLKYVSQLYLTKEINKCKLPELVLSQKETMLKIITYKYLPTQEVVEERNRSEEHSNKNSMDPPNEKESFSSNKSSDKKVPFLEAYSKYPQNVQNKNRSEVKQIPFQHSYISQRFTHPPQTVEQNSSNNNKLFISFKKSDDKNLSGLNSQQVHQNEKNHLKKPMERQYIDIIQEHSQSAFNSEQSNKQIKIIEPKEISKLSASEEKQMELFQHSKDEKKSSQYYQDVKHSANFAMNSKSSKKSSGIHENSVKYNMVEGSQFSKNSQKNSQASKNMNEYMFPERQSQSGSNKRSKISLKPKQQKSSSIMRGSRPQLKSTSRSKGFGSPASKISFSRSIKVLHFNQAECKGDQGYQLPTPTVFRNPVEPIKVEKTLRKPKFGFACEEQSVRTDREELVGVQPLEQTSAVINEHEKSSSISLSPSIASQHFTQIPQNFGDLLGVSPKKVKTNTYDSKIKELELKIYKMQEKKSNIEQQVFHKNRQINKLKSQMPVSANMLEQENQELLKVLKKPKQRHIQKQFKMNKNTEFRGQILQINAQSIKDEVKKKLLYPKCKLFQSEQFLIGMQIKNRIITFYFSFYTNVEECWIRSEQKSLKVSQPLDAKIYKIYQQKQIKFKMNVLGYQLFRDDFQFGQLKVDIKKSSDKRPKTFKIVIPYHLYHQLTFYKPQLRAVFDKSSDWHFCCPLLYSNKYYLQDFLPNGKFNEGTYLTTIELQDEKYSYAIVIQTDKFKIEYSSQNEGRQIPILKCLIQLFQK